MALTDLDARVAYSGNGVTTVFPITFPYYESTEIRAIVRVTATGVETEKALTTHFTLSGGDGETGNLTMLVAPATGERLEIFREPALTQTKVFEQNDSLPVKELEQALDRGVMVSQRLSDRLDRALILKDSDEAADLSLPLKDDRASLFLAFDADGLPIAAAAVDSSVLATAYAQTLLDDANAATARGTLDAQQELTSLTAETAPAAGDLFPLNDISVPANRKMTLANMLKVVNDLTAKSSPTLADLALIYDAAGTAAKKATLADILATVMTPGQTKNLGLTLSGGTLSICSADGTALSSTNPGYVCIQSKTAGLNKVYRITANIAFLDDNAASEIIGNLFGTTTGVAWANDCPFFIYFGCNDAETSVMAYLSRDPRASVTPAETAIGAPDDPVADTESSFFAFDSLAEVDYEANPCACVGAIRMTKTTLDDWTVSALSTKDGFGKFHDSTKFTYPQAQNGATTGSHLKTNGGTPPQCNDEEYFYWMRRDGSIQVQVYYNGDAGAGDGSGAQSLLFSVPCAINSANAVLSAPAFVELPASTGIGLVTNDSTTGLNVLKSTGVAYTNGDFSNGNRQIRFTLQYRTTFTD